jgi:hypothetical protein
MSLYLTLMHHSWWACPTEFDRWQYSNNTLYLSVGPPALPMTLQIDTSQSQPAKQCKYSPTHLLD